MKRLASIILSLTINSLIAHSTDLPPHARQVQSFFANLESNRSHIPNILDMPPEDFDLRIMHLSSSTDRILSLLDYNPSATAQKFIARFFKMYAPITHKRLDAAHLKKNDKRMLKRHELAYIRDKINKFATDLEKALMFVSRNDAVTLQMGYDMTIVNTFFKQLFPAAAYPRASRLQELSFNLKHSGKFRRKLIGSVAVIGTGIGGFFFVKTLLHKERNKYQHLSAKSLDLLSCFAENQTRADAALHGLHMLEIYIIKLAPLGSRLIQSDAHKSLTDLNDTAVSQMVDHANALRLLNNEVSPDPFIQSISNILDSIYKDNKQRLQLTNKAPTPRAFSQPTSLTPQPRRKSPLNPNYRTLIPLTTRRNLTEQHSPTLPDPVLPTTPKKPSQSQRTKAEELSRQI